MKQALIVLICVLMMAFQTTCTQVTHLSDTVVGNLLAEPYLAILLSILCIITTLI